MQAVFDAEGVLEVVVVEVVQEGTVDRGVEESLRTTVKRSLQELSRAINGDAKTETKAAKAMRSMTAHGGVMKDGAEVIVDCSPTDDDATKLQRTCGGGHLSVRACLCVALSLSQPK